MKRDKKIILVCHCILNCNSKVEGLSEYKGALEFNKRLIDQGFGIIQLPCPEMMMYGIKRWGHVKEQFDNPIYRNKCRELLVNYIYQIEMYLKSNYEVKGIIAIDGSPSCGYNLTCSSSSWYGELSGCHNLLEKMQDISMVKGSGIFIEELIKLLKENNINVPILAIDESNLEESLKNIEEQIFIK